MYAITPKGVGKKVGARSIKPEWDLAEGETFTVEEWHENLVLAEDETSLRAGTDQELNPDPVIKVSAWQIRKALNQINLRTTVEMAVSNSPDQDLKDGWEYAKEFESNNPLVLSMGKSISKTEAEMYQVFQLAETL